MSDLSRHRPYLIGGAVVVGLAIVIVLALVPTGAWVAIDERRSATRVTPDGVAAWARSLEALGVEVSPRFRSFTEEPLRGSGLVILEPMVPPTAAEAHLVLEWVRGGGTLVYSPAGEGLIADSLGIDVRLTPTSRRIVGPQRDSLVDHPWSGGGLAGPRNSLLRLEADSARAESWVPLSVVGERRFTTLAWLPEGEGGVLVLAAGEELANRTLEASIQAIAATRAVVDRIEPGDTLFFSEFHQALDGRRGVFREAFSVARGTRWGRTVLHVAFAAILLLLLTSRRFGSPFPQGDGERRSTLEHVEALAGIYRAAGSTRTVAHNLIRGAARRLGAVHPSKPDPEIEILAAWQLRPELAQPASAALEALRSDPPDLAALERALDAITACHTNRVPGP